MNNPDLDCMTIKELKKFAQGLDIAIHYSINTKDKILQRIRNSTKYMSIYENNAIEEENIPNLSLEINTNLIKTNEYVCIAEKGDIVYKDIENGDLLTKFDNHKKTISKYFLVYYYTNLFNWDFYTYHQYPGYIFGYCESKGLCFWDLCKYLDIDLNNCSKYQNRKSMIDKYSGFVRDMLLKVCGVESIRELYITEITNQEKILDDIAKSIQSNVDIKNMIELKIGKTLFSTDQDEMVKELINILTQMN